MLPRPGGRSTQSDKKRQATKGSKPPQRPQHKKPAEKRQKTEQEDAVDHASRLPAKAAKKAAELERFLFGRSDAPQLADPADSSAGADQQLSLIWEDRTGADAALADAMSSDDDAAGSGDGNDSDKETAATAAPSDIPQLSDDSSSDDEDSDAYTVKPSSFKSLLHKRGLVVHEHGSSSSDAASSSGEDDNDNDAERAMTESRTQSGKLAGPSSGAAWEDPADTSIQVNLASRNRLRKLRTKESQTVIQGAGYEAALRQQHATMNPRTSWAELPGGAGVAGRGLRKARGFGSDSDDDDDGGEELLQTAGGLLASSRGGLLPPSMIETTRMKDGNMHDPCGGVVQALRFHPAGQLLMTASMDKRLRFFQVDGVRNPKVQSVFLEDLPIRSAAFAAGGDQIVASGRRCHFYIYDIASGAVNRVSAPAGRREDRSLETFAVSPPGVTDPLVAFNGDQGYVPLVSLKTRQWVANLKMHGSARCCTFSPDGRELMTLGGDGVLYTWDLRMRRCLSKQQDEGCLGPAALAMSHDARYLATGSSMGAVNLYQAPQSDGMGPAGAGGRGQLSMVKTLMNLTTVVDSLAFSPDSQMLAIASRMKKDALRLVHLPSATVFSNWPTPATPLNYVHCLDFSPRGGFLAVGNAKGRALLYRLHHYAEV